MTDKPSIALMIDTEGNKTQDNLCIILRPVTDNGHIRNPDREGGLSDLELRANYNPPKEDRPAYWQGWGIEYRSPFAVTLEFAEVMVKTLKRIQRHKEKLADRFGYSPDFQTDAVRFADAVGATVIIRHKAGGGWSYDDNEYTRFPVSGLPDVLTRMLNDLK